MATICQIFIDFLPKERPLSSPTTPIEIGRIDASHFFSTVTPKTGPALGGCNLRRATPYHITNDERIELEALAQLDPKLHVAGQRAMVILAIDHGEKLPSIAGRLGLSLRSVSRWRKNFLENRIQGILRNTNRSGRTPFARQNQTQPILEATRNQIPPNGRKWSCRSMAAHLNVSVGMVQRVWKSAGIDSHSLHDHATQPPFRHDDRLRILGCFFLGGRRAMAIEILRTTVTLDSPWPNEPIVVATLGILGQCATIPVRRQLKMQVDHQLCFLEEIERRAEPDSQLRLITDGVDTFSHARVRRWLAKSGRFATHFSSAARELLFDAEAALRDYSQERFVQSIQANLTSLSSSGQPLLIAPLEGAFHASTLSLGMPTGLATNLPTNLTGPST